MLIIENITLALAGLYANKGRAVLTMLGIVIGIASVIAVLTVGDAVNNSVTSSMGDLGANNITIFLQEKSSEDIVGVHKKTAKDYITEDMLISLKKRFPQKVQAFSLNQNIGNARAGDSKNYANASIVGVNNGYLKSNPLKLTQGNIFTGQDQQNGKRVALVSDRYAQKIFGSLPAVGKTTEIMADNKYYTYTIVGVYEYHPSAYEKSTVSEKDLSTNLYIPIKTAMQQGRKEFLFDELDVVAREGTDMAKFEKEIENYFNQQYYGENENFQIMAFSNQTMIKGMSQMMSTIKLAISAIAGISLLVGGIGVMNIMFVSITERTREIGTRKALGATNDSIRLQFIMEAIVICVIGGAIGIVLGLSIGFAVTALLHYKGTASAGAISVCVLFSVVFGLFFGYYPANKAAKMNPIEALRYE